MSKWNKKEDEKLSGIYMSPDLCKMHELNFMQKSTKSSQYAVWIAAGSLIVAIISLIISIIK
jgi:hypothetical protein